MSEMESVVEKKGEDAIDMLQQLLDEKVRRVAKGTASASFFSGGFEGEIRVDVKEVRVMSGENKLVVEVEGHNGGFIIAISNS